MPKRKPDITINNGLPFDYDQALKLIGKVIKGVHVAEHCLILVFDDKSSLSVVGKRDKLPLGIEFVNSRTGGHCKLPPAKAGGFQPDYAEKHNT